MCQTLSLSDPIRRDLIPWSTDPAALIANASKLVVWYIANAASEG